jgi:hypothetical protein
MNGKMMTGIGSIVGIVAIALLAAPIQAYVNGNIKGDMRKIQTQERLKTQDCTCKMLQMQEQERIRTQNRDCDGVCTQAQYRYRQRVNECSTNSLCNCTKNIEQYRNQNMERTTNVGN